ncbi:MAG: phage tail tape measure protein [Roseovarius sp.]|nr:phage tail tape measure protein [Roseovarius sp.]
MDDLERADDLEAQIAALDAAMGQAGAMAAAFAGELGRVRGGLSAAGQDAQSLERGLSRGLRGALRGAVVEGDSLSESLRRLATTLVNTAFNDAVRPVTDQVGGLLSQGVGALLGGLLPFAKGAGFTQGRVMPFATGGVVSGPVAFPMRGGRTGLMGEAGPEAILPLSRGADGRLGVRAQGGGAVSVVMNVTTPDVDGFRRSQGQIAAQLGRVIGRGARNR